MLSHSDFGELKCCGCLSGIVKGDIAIIACKECDAVVQTVPAALLCKTLHEMELSLELASAECPYWGAINLRPGFSQLLAYRCDNCGEAVKVEGEDA